MASGRHEPRGDRDAVRRREREHHVRHHDQAEGEQRVVRRSQREVSATSGTTETATTSAYPVISSPIAESSAPRPAASCGSSATGRFSEVTDAKQAALRAPSAIRVRGSTSIV
ncbi:hypothetical protein GCM10017567_57040 [Amycolatopsis bullii]|uniref:Uncharacterized protein n=1 Tax=Amycolatopsis bullii TaxID=941987 RepID=A0ABQ3KSK0_9PSEU|nr:hypothetical protein GCM10017567_57040 [Amycolatopsis bullii]